MKGRTKSKRQTCYILDEYLPEGEIDPAALRSHPGSQPIMMKYGPVILLEQALSNDCSIRLELIHYDAVPKGEHPRFWTVDWAELIEPDEDDENEPDEDSEPLRYHQRRFATRKEAERFYQRTLAKLLKTQRLMCND